MGDSIPQPADESKMLAQSGGKGAHVSQESANVNRNAEKGRQETLSQQNIPQTSYAQGHSPQYPSPYHQSQTRSDPYNLSQLNTALPDVSYQNYGHLPQRFPPAPGSSGLGYATQNSPQYATPQAVAPNNAQYPYQAPFQGIYVAGNPAAVAGIGNQFYHPGYIGRQQQHGSPYIMPPNQFPLHNPAFPGMQHPSQYGSRGSVSEESRGTIQQRPNGDQGGSDSIGKLRPHKQYQSCFYWILVAHCTV